MIEFSDAYGDLPQSPFGHDIEPTDVPEVDIGNGYETAEPTGTPSDSGAS